MAYAKTTRPNLSQRQEWEIEGGANPYPASAQSPNDYRWLMGSQSEPHAESARPASTTSAPAAAGAPGASGVTHNAAGAPVYPGNNISDFLGYADPHTAVNQALASLGGTTWAQNPWVSMLMKYAPGMPLMHAMTGVRGSEGFNDWLQSYVGAMRAPKTPLAGSDNPLYSFGELKGMLQAMRGGTAPAAIQERLTNMDPKTSYDTLVNLLSTAGMTATNPFFLEAALNDLQQKMYDYNAYVNYGTDVTPTNFWDYLQSSGWLDRYFQ